MNNDRISHRDSRMKLLGRTKNQETMVSAFANSTNGKSGVNSKIRFWSQANFSGLIDFHPHPTPCPPLPPPPPTPFEIIREPDFLMISDEIEVS